MPIEIDEDKLYFFTALVDGKYRTVFVGWLNIGVIRALTMVDGVSSFAHIVLDICENMFVSNIGAPLYLLDYDNKEIFKFTDDDNELDLFPSGNAPDDFEGDRIIQYPAYFEKEVEPLFEFKIHNQFWAKVAGVWEQLDI